MKMDPIVKSSRDGKKWMTKFHYSDGRFKTVHFGASGHDDFTIMQDREKAEKKRSSYIERHGNEDWSKPDAPAALSRWILWELPSREKAEKKFRKKFRL